MNNKENIIIEIQKWKELNHKKFKNGKEFWKGFWEKLILILSDNEK